VVRIERALSALRKADEDRHRLEFHCASDRAGTFSNEVIAMKDVATATPDPSEKAAKK
jgi:hypothetical protein